MGAPIMAAPESGPQLVRGLQYLLKKGADDDEILCEVLDWVDAQKVYSDVVKLSKKRLTAADMVDWSIYVDIPDAGC